MEKERGGVGCGHSDIVLGSGGRGSKGVGTGCSKGRKEKEREGQRDCSGEARAAQQCSVRGACCREVFEVAGLTSAV